LSCTIKLPLLIVSETGEEASVPYKQYGAPPLCILLTGCGRPYGTDITECRCLFFIEIKGIGAQNKGGDVFYECVKNIKKSKKLK